MLEYATKLTLLPSKVTSGDVDQLRKAGFSDRDVLDIAEVTAYLDFDPERRKASMHEEVVKW